MRITRVYFSGLLAENSSIDLPLETSHYLSNVLRLSINDSITLFNGDGYDYAAEIITIHKKIITVSIKHKTKNNNAPSLHIHLVQAVCRGEKMDLVIQKATELGVSAITPVFTEFTNVKLSSDRLIKKVEHWQKVANSACEQSGRADLVTINQPVKFEQLIRQDFAGAKVILSPHENQAVSIKATITSVNLLIGPEGGFSEQEVKQAVNNGFQPWQLGTRILRTETAGLTAIAVLQSRYGDLV